MSIVNTVGDDDVGDDETGCGGVEFFRGETWAVNFGAGVENWGTGAIKGVAEVNAGAVVLNCVENTDAGRGD